MTSRALRLAFFGTPEFAVPTLERLCAGRHPVAVVLTQPDRPRGRGRRTSASPVAHVAEERGLPVLRPERVGAPEVVEQIVAHSPDLGVVVAFGQFLPRRVREAPLLGFLINGHASLLPHLRGAAPIAHAILLGDEQTGISVMRVEREMDAGPVALTRSTPIGAEENAGQLAERLSQLAADAIERVVEDIAQERAVWTDQDASRATFAPKLERGEGRLDWREPAEALARRVRAFAPRPGAFTTLSGEPLRILAARALAEPTDREPGRVRWEPGEALRIATGEGWLEPHLLQRAGGRPLEVPAFLRGHPIADGTHLGSEREASASAGASAP